MTTTEQTRWVAGIAVSQPGALWRRWVALTTAGEVLGFIVPAVVAALTTVGGVEGLPQVAVLMAAGAVRDRKSVV